MQCAGLFCVDIYELCLEFGVHYLLAAVQAEVAREHIGYAAGEREIHKVSRAEELNAQDDGCDGAVDRAAEALFELIAGKSPDPADFTLPVELIVRETTAQAR